MADALRSRYRWAMAKAKKNPAAVTLGKLGGAAKSPAKAAAARANGQAGGAPATGGAGERWMIQLRLEPGERKRVVAAADRAGQSVGEWIAARVREALR